MSDTQSLTSNSSAGTAANATFLELEDIGKLGLGEIPANNPIKRLVIGKYLNKKSSEKSNLHAGCLFSFWLSFVCICGLPSL